MVSPQPASVADLLAPGAALDAAALDALHALLAGEGRGADADLARHEVRALAQKLRLDGPDSTAEARASRSETGPADRPFRVSWCGLSGLRW